MSVFISLLDCARVCLWNYNRFSPEDLSALFARRFLAHSDCFSFFLQCGAWYQAKVVESSVTVNNNVNRVLSGPGNATWVQTFPRPYSVIGMNFSVTFLTSTISFGRLRFLFLISACNFCSLHYLLNENKKVNSNYSL